ncbi:SDR family NAD(P)-dependent oxidoreductase [Gordonia sp. CPCC 206044]|uniref:SDR family NAD(P)-dependent oxidoreductase n=1 Tax=Gordonia sp. CPCC 206044 TaxID=3140793 RepID=UPI003AF3AAF4
MQIAGNVFVVTGAGNGIGRRVALELVARGGIVAGVDRDPDGLATTRSRSADPERFSPHVLDIADTAAVDAFPDEVTAAHGRVDGLFNIAGISQEFETVAGVTDARIEQIMRVNFFGTVAMTRAFLPLLEARPEAVIMNTSSLSAMVPYPGAAIYGASKAAVALFSYGLTQDLRGSSSVTVTTVIPGTVWTDLVRNSSQTLGTPEALAKGFAMKPEKAAHRMVEATMKGRSRVVIGKDAHFFGGARRISSRLADRLSYVQVGRFVYGRNRKPAPTVD